MEKEIENKLGIMVDFYKKLNENFGLVQLTMEDDVLVLKVHPKSKAKEEA